jgi:hypothetical protein
MRKIKEVLHIKFAATLGDKAGKLRFRGTGLAPAAGLALLELPE